MTGELKGKNMGQRNSSSFKNADALLQPLNKQYFTSKLQWRNLKSKMDSFLTVLYSPSMVWSLSVDWATTLSRPGVPALICSIYKSDKVLLNDKDMYQVITSSLSVWFTDVYTKSGLKGLSCPISLTLASLRCDSLINPFSCCSMFATGVFFQTVLLQNSERKEEGKPEKADHNP